MKKSNEDVEGTSVVELAKATTEYVAWLEDHTERLEDLVVQATRGLAIEHRRRFALSVAAQTLDKGTAATAVLSRALAFEKYLETGKW